VGTPPRSLRSLERVDPEEFSRRVALKLEGAAGHVDVRFGAVHVTLPAGDLLAAVRLLQGDPELDCAYFTFLYSLTYGATVIAHVRLPAEDPVMPSLTGVYGGANWHERECAEMFGILFEGHPNLVKLYLPEDFEGYPLRKSFRLASRRFKSWPGAKDEEEAQAGGPLR